MDLIKLGIKGFDNKADIIRSTSHMQILKTCEFTQDISKMETN